MAPAPNLTPEQIAESNASMEWLKKPYTGEPPPKLTTTSEPTRRLASLEPEARKSAEED
jgi:hypothetical protein